MKEKLNIQEQILHMKNKGIVFKKTKESEAEDILSNRIYYFKLKSYAKIFPKTNDKYDNLDFFYLYELSKIDMGFRNLILNITLNIEHLAKTSFLCKLSNSKEDGYKIVDDFFKSQYGKGSLSQVENIRNKIQTNPKLVGGTYDLIKHYDKEIPAWVLVEFLTFNNFKEFYKFSTNRNEELKIIESKIILALDSTKWLRNLAAHNSPILIKLTKTIEKKRKYLHSLLAPIAKRIINKDDNYTLEYMLTNALVVDFLEMIILFSKICKSEKMKQYTIENLQTFYKNTLKKEVMQNNQILHDFFNFTWKSCKELL